jgi:hypothetical protein
VRRSLLDLNAHSYQLHQRRAEYLRKKELFTNERFLAEATEKLFSPRREYILPADPRRRGGHRRAKILLLELREMNHRPFNLVVFQTASPRPQPHIRCFVGHRFTGRIQETFRHNLAELASALRLRVTYGDFDGAAIELIGSLRRQIAGHDFCLFDNRDTTQPSKPNVYIEAGDGLRHAQTFGDVPLPPRGVAIRLCRRHLSVVRHLPRSFRDL